MPVPFEVSATVGPLLIGAVLNAMLYGILVVQCFIYFQTYKRERKWIKYFILYLFLMETCNTVFDIGIAFEPLVLGFGDPATLAKTPTLIILDAPVTVILGLVFVDSVFLKSESQVLLSTPVQFFIAWRIKIVGESWIMPIIIGFFSTCSFVGGMTVGIFSAFLRERAQLVRCEPAVITWLVSSAVSDILITLSLSRSLFKRRTGISKHIDEKVMRIILLTIQTGTITTLFSLADVIIFLIIPQTNINFAPDFALSKLCTNSLLCTLNARSGWSNLTGTANNADAIALFGEIGSLGSRKSGYPRASGHDEAMRADLIELQSKSTGDDQVKLGTLESGIHVHKVIQQH